MTAKCFCKYHVSEIIYHLIEIPAFYYNGVRFKSVQTDLLSQTYSVPTAFRGPHILARESVVLGALSVLAFPRPKMGLIGSRRETPKWLSLPPPQTPLSGKDISSEAAHVLLPRC